MVWSPSYGVLVGIDLGHAPDWGYKQIVVTAAVLHCMACMLSAKCWIAIIIVKASMGLLYGVRPVGCEGVCV